MTATAQNAHNNNHLLEIRAYGQSIWMDNLNRTLIESGDLKKMITDQDISGITSNPSIFQKAIAGNEVYDGDIEAGIRANKSVDEIYESLVFEDIRNACDIFRSVYDDSNGKDGFVSIELPPDLARDTEGSIKAAQRYFDIVDRPNVMIKIPGTPEGIPAVEESIKNGINVNITLLFSIQSYVDAAWAYIRGLEARAAEGKDISNIASVASFFLSRIDVKVDEIIEEKLKGLDDLSFKAMLEELEGKVAIANAKLAYQEYKKIISSDRWQALAKKGANVQRLLWASTSTKNPHYSDVMYVNELIGPDTVNTMPPGTIEACADHCDIASRVEQDVESAHKTMETLPKVGIDLDAVMDELLEEGIEKFVKPFNSLMDSLDEKVKNLSPV
jgi:transaldolase